jgi:MFS family permease
MRTLPGLRFLADNARWLGAGLALTFASSFGQTFFVSLFAGEIMAAHGLSDGGWGALYTVATLGSAAVLFQAGALADRVRLERLAPLMLLLYAGGAAAMALLLAAGGGPVALLVLVVFALRFCGQGMMSHLAITAMGRWFRAHRGKAVAVAGLGFSLGEAVLPAVVVALLAAIGSAASWGLVAGVLALGFAPLLGLLLAEGRAPQGAAGTEDAPGLDGRHWSRTMVLRHWSFWALLPAVLTPPFIGTVVFFHQVHIAGTKGWPLAAMAAGFPVYAALTVAAGLAGGALADRIGPARLLPVYILPFAAGTALIGWAEAPWVWIVALGLLGLTQGSAQALWGALWPELYGTRHLGGVRAMATTAMVFSTAAGPGITGLLIDAGIDFPAQTGALALWCLAVAAIGLAVTRALPGRAAA